MRTSILSAVLATAIAGTLAAQPRLTALSFGNGSDGAFAPTADVTLDSDTQSCYQFTTFSIPSGVTVTLIGSKPIYIKCTGACRIEGKLVADGSVGGNGANNAPGGVGGAGGAGGGKGGDGGTLLIFDGSDGEGLSGGKGGQDSNRAGGGSFTDPVGGGGGGGNVAAGANGGAPNAGTTPNVSGDGGAALPECRAGSGGGGGGNDVDSLTAPGSNDGGGGGGGGGGWVTIAAPQVDIASGAEITANGGNGGDSAGNGGAGGGGAGGCIDFAAPIVNNAGALSAVGGDGGAATQGNCGCSPGGAGSEGCINVYGVLTGAGTSMPTATQKAPALLVNCGCDMDVEVDAGSGVSYLTGADVLPTNTPTPWGTACALGPFFVSILFADNVPSLLTNLNGTGKEILKVSCGSTLMPPIADIPLRLQSLSLAGGAPNRLSSCLVVVIKAQ